MGDNQMPWVATGCHGWQPDAVGDNRMPWVTTSYHVWQPVAIGDSNGCQTVAMDDNQMLQVTSGCHGCHGWWPVNVNDDQLLQTTISQYGWQLVAMSANWLPSSHCTLVAVGDWQWAASDDYQSLWMTTVSRWCLRGCCGWLLLPWGMTSSHCCGPLAMGAHLPLRMITGHCTNNRLLINASKQVHCTKHSNNTQVVLHLLIELGAIIRIISQPAIFPPQTFK